VNPNPTPRNPVPQQPSGRRVALSAAAVALILASAPGCARIVDKDAEADPAFANAYELLNEDGTIVIDARTPGHPTRDELGFGDRSTFGAIDADDPFPVRLELPTGDVTLRSDGAVMTSVEGHRDDLTLPPEHITVNTSFASVQEARAAFDAATIATLGLPAADVDRATGNVESGAGLASNFWRGVVRGYEDDDVLVEVEFMPSADETGVAVNYLISVRRSEQPA
jgi:hypothetical protein